MYLIIRKEKKVLNLYFFTYNGNMPEHTLTVIIIIFSIIFVIAVSILIIFESIETNQNREESLKDFTVLENRLSTGGFSLFSSQMHKYYFTMPTLKTLRIKNDENLPIYLFSSSKIDPKLIEYNFEGQYNSIYETVYKNVITLANTKYSLEAAFTIFTKIRLYNFAMKISIIFFIYLLFVSCSLIYIYSNKKRLSTSTRIDHGVLSDPDYHNPDRKITDELKKSAALDQDIVLTLVGAPEKLIFENASEFEEILNRNFPFRDLIFRYNDDIFGILLPNTDLEQGIHQIEMFDQIFVSSSTKSLKFPIMFGLSSRNGRLISGNIILKEAKAALKKAMSDTDFPIVGFRPNPARYREYLSKLKTKS